MTEQGKYIVLEGGEGSGKDAQLDSLETWLKEEYPDKNIVIIQEPDSDPVLGPIIRELLNEKDPTRNFMALDAWQQAMLMNAARRSVIAQVNDHLGNGDFVLSNRNYLSTIAYQLYAGGIRNERNAMETLCYIGTHGSEGPDRMDSLFIVLDINPAVAMSRIQDRPLDSIESKDLHFHNTVREGFLREALIVQERGPFSDKIQAFGAFVIDAERTTDEVFEDIRDVVSEFLVATNFGGIDGRAT